MKLSDRLTGAMLLVLGALAWWGGSKLPPVPGQQVGPDVFPMVIGIGLMLCGLLIILGIGKGFEEDEKIIASESGEVAEALPEADAPGGLRGLLSGWKALLPPAALFFYYFASERLGFWLTATLMVLVLARSQGGILLALLAPPLVHLVFYKLLRVPLPPGLLNLPWA